MNKRKVTTLFLLSGVVMLVFFFYRFFQPSITYSLCSLCDGNQYQRMFNYVTGEESVYTANFPYYSRILVPALAGIFSKGDIVLGFQIVNLLFSVLGVLSLYYLWTKLEIPAYLIAIAIGWLLFHWTGLIRLNALDPVTVDLPTYFIQSVFIIIVFNKRYEWLLLLGPIAVLQRESITVLLLVLLVYKFLVFKQSPEDREWKQVWIIVLALGLTVAAKSIFTYYFPPSDFGKSSVRLVAFYIKEVITDPFKLVRWLVAIFMAYGMFLMLAAVNFKKTDLKFPSMIFLSIYSLLSLLLGLIAGGDFTRIIFLGFPFIMSWILIELKKVPPVLVFIAVGLSIWQMRLFNIIPDPGIDFEKFASWYPEFANYNLVVGWFIFFLICFTIITVLNRIFQKKSGWKNHFL